MKRGWEALAALVIISSAVPLAQVAFDRNGTPRGSLTLTHREMMVGWSRDENSGETLIWSWATSPDLDSVPAHELPALGLHCGERTVYECGYGNGRRGYMVVGLDLGRWQASIDSLKMRIDSVRAIVPADSLTDLSLRGMVGQMEQLVLRTSRLRMQAIGQDPAALAAAWNDGAHLVLAAELTAYRNVWPRDSLDRTAPHYRVHAEPLPSALYVPARFAEAVRDTVGTRNEMYQVEVVVGRRWLPRVTMAEKLPDPKLPIAE
jgi:hypothetical protein